MYEEKKNKKRRKINSSQPMERYFNQYKEVIK